ncbi:unnamed protein product [Arabidopsis lyrata]|nr:uncharacterized protein LOC9316046 [Arabidopsis lyrata subsp. lyrata]XP_020884270.1 uncharacterized protein LOC9316046 [Arabidopsis lyrata subsp. lyrata]XP_020884271.1 uncharacterized protein LOC9316046 [Arabidopsis lyrata subsp. lyrata]CAH8265677.1 unnamed protein product [Arabidopsis lyrata]|eukprot:XP_020884269.1 uncharacterized protein LOC9316046 [Arabidopsis lyrata subsp. lyrata]
MMKARTTNNVQSKRSTKSVRKDQKLQKTNSQKKTEQEKHKDLDAKEESSNISTVASDSTTQSDPSEVYETVDVRYLDDDQGSDSSRVVDKTEKEHNLSGSLCDLEKDVAENVCKVANIDKEIDTDVREGINADVWEDASNGALSAGSENEAADVTENNGGNFEDGSSEEKIERLETRIEKLEEELREVAALEISLYSVVPDHCSSAHKLHTPARRISRIYIHACKHFTQGKRATIARNSVSGLVLVAKSCGNDVSRLTFWLSNIIALRQIISQAFGRSRITQISEPNERGNGDSGKKTNLRWKNGFQQLLEDWQETETFTTALEKIEFWVFSRIVESVWWQVFTPHMQSPENDSSASKTNGKLMGPSLGDQNQGTFSISLWKNAFRDALQRLCPMRGAGHECGCLPVLARMVMDKCIGRFDVAMFNAILRESEHQIPTDPVSDPILDSKVLPIPAGDLSFGSGAQLKNAIGNWSRCLTEMFGMNSDDSSAKEKRNSEDDHVESKAFVLLNELSDLLMLPKDMLMEIYIREEICPSITLPLIKRILCNFTPDEFCPDHVPGAVLEELNASESIGDRKLSEASFPYAASSVSYMPPSTMDIAEKVAEAAGKLSRNVSMIQRKGYTSDEELEELDSPLTSIVDKASDFTGSETSNARYKLLRQVWV